MPLPLRRSLEMVFRCEGRQLARVLVQAGEYRVGHERTNDIALDDSSISGRHAVLTVVSEEEIYLKDLGSVNGTYVDGQLCREALRLGVESLVQLGSSSLVFQRAGLPAAVFLQAPPELLTRRFYEWGEPLVRGGISTIYEGRDLSLGRPVAIRVMQPASQHSARTVLRFVREAQIMGQLQHPQVPPVYELKVSEEGQLYYTTRAIEGLPLAALLERLRQKEAAVQRQWTQAALIAAWQKAADAVAFAHSRGVVHCALRPENIVAGDFGEVMVLGWTFARLFSEGLEPVEAKRQVRAAGEPITPGLSPYTAPEQAAGTGIFDDRVDIYALGAVLYSLLSLGPPFPEMNEERLEQQITDGMITPLEEGEDGVERPAALARVVMKALSISPERRQGSVSELQAEVAAAVAPTTARKKAWGLF